MDNLTHSLFALTVARTRLSRAGRGTAAALVLASNAPDVDIVTVIRGTESYLKWHRGPTHGPLGIVGLGIVSAALVWVGRSAYDRWRAGRQPAPREAPERNASFVMLVALAIVGTLLHVAMDLPTQYGTRLFSPFDWRWFSIDLMPIVDVYLLAALAAGLAFGRQSAAARERNAAIVLVLMAANYGFRAVEHAQALAMVPRLFGPTSAPPCDTTQQSDERRPIDVWPRSRATTSSTGQRCLVELAAMPTFISPFRWQIIAHVSNAYELRDVDLLDRRWLEPEDESEAPWRTTLRYPNVWTPTVTRAADTRLGQVFLGFSRFPAARSAIDAHGVTTVRWTDVRFASGGVALTEQRRVGPSFFTATVVVGADGQIVQERLGR
jgi:inner membrane protein